MNLDPASNPAVEPNGALQYGSLRRPGHPEATVTFLDQRRAIHDQRTGRFHRCIQHHGSARDRVEHIHGVDERRVWSVDLGCDHAGRVFADGIDGADLS